MVKAKIKIMINIRFSYDRVGGQYIVLKVTEGREDDQYFINFEVLNKTRSKKAAESQIKALNNTK